MNKLLIALIAGGFATVAAAQTAAPAAAPVTKAEVNKEKAKTTEAVTTKAGENTTGGPATKLDMSYPGESPSGSAAPILDGPRTASWQRLAP